MIAPLDALLFSEQTFAFTQANQDDLSGLLNRAFGDDGADSHDGAPGLWGRADATLLNAGDPFRASGGGLEVGGDTAVAPAARIGAAVGYETIGLTDSQGGDASQEIVRVGLYGSAMAGPVTVSAAASYAHAWDRTERDSGVGPSDATRGSDAFTGGVQLSAPFSQRGVAITPTAGILVSDVSGGAFTERNGVLRAFAIHGDGASVTTVAPYAQVSLSRAFAMRDGAVLTPDLTVGYRYDGAANADRTTLVSEDGTVFFGNKVSLDPNSALVSAGLTTHKDGLSGFIRYRATVSSNWLDQSLTAGLRWSF